MLLYFKIWSIFYIFFGNLLSPSILCFWDSHILFGVAVIPSFASLQLSIRWTIYCLISWFLFVQFFFFLYSCIFLGCFSFPFFFKLLQLVWKSCIPFFVVVEEDSLWANICAHLLPLYVGHHHSMADRWCGSVPGIWTHKPGPAKWKAPNLASVLWGRPLNSIFNLCFFLFFHQPKKSLCF